jgi:hypothetical protein
MNGLALFPRTFSGVGRRQQARQEDQQGVYLIVDGWRDMATVLLRRLARI